MAGKKRADNSYTVQYNHDRLVIVKRRPEKYNLQLATERQCISMEQLTHAPLSAERSVCVNEPLV